MEESSFRSHQILEAKIQLLENKIAQLKSENSLLSKKLKEQTFTTKVTEHNYSKIKEQIYSAKEVEIKQQSQISLLKKIGSINSIINKAKTLDELKKLLCNIIISYTASNEVWLVKQKAKAFINYYYHSSDNSTNSSITNNTAVTANRKQTTFTPLNDFNKRINLVSSESIIHLPKFQSIEAVNFQIIVQLKIKSAKYYLGLNYGKDKENHDDIEFLQKVAPQIRLAFDNLGKHELLLQNEAKYRGLIEKQSDVVYVRNMEGIYTYVSPSVMNYGYTPEEILGKRNTDFIHPDYIDMVTEFIQNFIKQKKKTLTLPKIKIILKEGREMVVHVTFTNLLDQPGIEGIVVNVHDITEQSKYEDQIKQNEYHYRKLFENSSDARLLVQNNTIILCNKKTEELLQTKDKHIIGKYIYDLFVDYHYEDKQPTEKINEIKRNIALRKNLSFEWKFVRSDRSTFYAHILITPAQMDNLNYSLVAIRDITKMKLATKKIQESEEQLRNIYDKTTNAVFITDLKANLLELNIATTKLFELDKEKLLNVNLIDLLKKEDHKMINNLLKKVINEKEIFSELSYKNKSGKQRHIESRAQLIDLNGKKVILHVVADISLRKEMERQILLATIRTEEKDRIRFAQDLHDGLGPYLSATKLYLKSLTQDRNKEQRNIIAHKAVESINEIIRNVKEISNNISPHILRNHGLISALNAFIKTISNCDVDIAVKTNIEDKRYHENIEISCFRILTELINNTIKYANANQIKIKVIDKQNTLVIIYKDNGEGFNVEKTFKEGKGQGLFNIINRVKSMDGKYKFLSHKKQFFYFLATIITK